MRLAAAALGRDMRRGSSRVHAPGPDGGGVDAESQISPTRDATTAIGAVRGAAAADALREALGAYHAQVSRLGLQQRLWHSMVESVVVVVLLTAIGTAIFSRMERKKARVSAAHVHALASVRVCSRRCGAGSAVHKPQPAR